MLTIKGYSQCKPSDCAKIIIEKKCKEYCEKMILLKIPEAELKTIIDDAESTNKIIAFRKLVKNDEKDTVTLKDVLGKTKYKALQLKKFKN